MGCCGLGGERAQNTEDKKEGDEKTKDKDAPATGGEEAAKAGEDAKAEEAKAADQPEDDAPKEGGEAVGEQEPDNPKGLEKKDEAAEDNGDSPGGAE